MSMSKVPFELIGGEPAIRALAERFYDAMDRSEPELAALHSVDDQGRVSRRSRDRFALFLIGWLGGPQDYMAQHGHPRLRIRHAFVPVNIGMRDAWLRCMHIAMDELGISPELRPFLDARFAEVADFLRNRDG
jgi:hemoglobin